MKKLGDIAFKDANIEILLDVVKKVDEATRKEVLKAISKRLTQAGKASAINNIKKIIQSADPEIKKWISKAIPQSYVTGINFTDYQFKSIRINNTLAKAIVKDTIIQIQGHNSKLAKTLKNVDTKNIYSWGDFYQKMGREVGYDKIAMEDIQNHMMTRWRMYTTEPKIMKSIAGNEFENYKLNFTVDDLKSIRDLSIHAGTVNSLLSDFYLDFANGMNGLAKGAERKINEAVKLQIRGKILSKEVTGMSIEKTAEEVKKLIGNQGFSVLTDRGGHNWSLQRYSEMLIRTHVMKASNEALINRAGQYGIDIVEISTHYGACPICIPYEGKVYSLSGDSKQYGRIPIQLPIHPNCRHVLLMRPDLE